MLVDNIQFLQENPNLKQGDMEVDYTSVTVQTQKEYEDPTALRLMIIVTADVYDSSQEIDDDFDFREITKRPFDSNMTGLLGLMSLLDEKPVINGVSGEKTFNVMEGENRWIGILAICIALFVLIMVIACICLFCWRKRHVPFSNFGLDIDTSESDEDVPASRQAESWESEDSAGMNGLAANSATVDVHKCNSATCPQCVKGAKNKPEFMRLTPRSIRWASLWQMTSPFNNSEPRSPSRSPRRSAMKSPHSRIGSKRVSFDASYNGGGE